MRYFLLIILACAGLAACNNAGPEHKAIVQAVPALPAKEPEATATGPMDPVCEMPLDKKWTELTVYEHDTIMFCSDNCKMAFMARPKKYFLKVKK